jgi:AcrR family transcriptional regulator
MSGMAEQTADQAPDGTVAGKRRGRPRDQVRHTAVLQAAGDLMIEGGLAAATMEAIAARAGVSKQTIYNWWPSRGAVALEGLMVRADPLADIPEDATAREAVRLLAVALVRLFVSTPAGPLLRSLVADAQSQPEIAQALRDQWLTPRRDAVVAILERGVARGELRSGVDAALVIDHALGSLYYRLLLGHEPLTEAAARRSVDLVWEGIERRG